MAGQLETRLREGPPIVADGGMGSLLTAAVPRLRSPEEANLRAPEAVVSLHGTLRDALDAVLRAPDGRARVIDGDRTVGIIDADVIRAASMRAR